LIGVLVAFAVLVAGAAFFATGGFGTIKNEEGEEYSRPDGLGKTTLGRARYAAEDSVCRQRLGQVRGLISLAADPVEETFPESLQQVSGLPQGYDKCPVGDEPYEYDDATGVVSCVHLGHEKY
jgi:hypothetical protein